MPRNIEARKVLVSHSGPRGMTAVGSEEACGRCRDETGMSTRAGMRLWRCGQDGGRLDLERIHFPLFPCGMSPTLHSGELPIDGYRIMLSQDELMCGEGSMGGLDH